MKHSILKMKNDYLDYVRATLSAGTYQCYSHHLKSIVNWFLINNLEINRKNLVQFIQESKDKGLSNKTINHRIICLKCMLKYSGVDSDIMNVKKLVVVNKPFDYLNYDKIKILTNLFLLCFLDTGVRLRELVSIEVQNIDFKNRTILLAETKNKNIRLLN